MFIAVISLFMYDTVYTHTHTHTLGVIGVGSPEGARGRGRSAAAPDAVPGRLRTPIAAS